MFYSTFHVIGNDIAREELLPFKIPFFFESNMVLETLLVT